MPGKVLILCFVLILTICCFPSTSKDKVGAKIEKYSEAEETGRTNVRAYIFGRFFNYVQNYDKVIEKR